MSVPSGRRRGAVLATVCNAVFAINLDATNVKVASPSLSRQLGAARARCNGSSTGTASPLLRWCSRAVERRPRRAAPHLDHGD